MKKISSTWYPEPVPRPFHIYMFIPHSFLPSFDLRALYATNYSPEQVSRSMVDMIVGETRHGEIAVVVTLLPPHFHLALALRCFLQLLG